MNNHYTTLPLLTRRIKTAGNMSDSK